MNKQKLKHLLIAGIYLLTAAVRPALAISDGQTGNDFVPIGSSGQFKVTDEASQTESYLVVDAATERVGIGTASPDADFDIEGAEDNEFIRLSDSTNADSVGIYTGNDSPDTSITAQAGSLFLRNNGSLYVNTNGTTAWSDVTAASSGDVTTVGPACTAGACFTDGATTTGTTFAIFEGTASDANEISLIMPSANPGADIDITFPSNTGTLISSGDTSTVSGTMIVNNTITDDDLAATLTFEDGDFLDFSSINGSSATEGILLPQGANVSAATGEGQISWDSDDNRLVIGTGGGQLTVATTDLFDTSAELAGILTDETGTGLAVFGTGPTISGSTLTGAHDAGGAGSFEIPNSAAPTVDAAGEIAVDTTIANYTGLIKYFDGTEELTGIAVPTAALTAVDGQVLAYNATNDEFEFVNAAGGGDVTAVGPACATGACLTDGVVTAGTTFAIFEGTASDANEISLIMPSANPGADIDITFPSNTGTLISTGDTGTVTSTMITNNTITADDLNATLSFSDGDLLDFSSINGSSATEGILLPQGANVSAATGEGQISWDNDDNRLVIGTGGGQLIVATTDLFDTSAELAGILTDETGTGLAVFGTGPTINGSTLTGAHDAGGAGSFEIPNAAAPTVDAAGEIAVDTTIANYTGLIKYFDGTEELTGIAVPTAALTAVDGQVLSYNATNDEFEFVNAAGGGDVTAVGPACATGACLTDGVVTAGTTFAIFEGTASDANEISLIMPSANPGADIDITFPSNTGTLISSGDTSTVSGTMIVNNTITDDDLAATLTFEDGDLLDFSSINGSSATEGILLPQGANVSAATGEGQISWDNDDNRLVIGTGGGQLIVATTDLFDTSAELAGILTDETGTGLAVFGTGPTISGSTLTGAHDAGGAGSFEIPNSAAPTVDAAGEIAVDTTIANYTGLIKYFDGAEELTAIAVPTAALTAVDGQVLSYNATNDEFEFVTVAAGTTTLQQAYSNDANGGNAILLMDATDGDVLFRGTGSTEILALDESAARVGIGSTAPAGKLEVENAADQITLLVDQDDNDQTALEITNAGTGNSIFVNQAANGSAFSVTTTATSATILDMNTATVTTGNVLDIDGLGITSGKGIFVSTDQSLDDADGAALFVDYETGSGNQQLDTLLFIESDCAGDTTCSAFSDNNRVFRIDSNGQAFSDVGFTAGAFSTTYGDGLITETGGPLSVSLAGGAGDDFIVDTNVLVVESDNNRVGIGTTAPEAALHVTTAARVGGNVAAAGLLEILEDTSDGSNKFSITAQAMAADYTLTFPVDDGTDGQVLRTNGSGLLTWAPLYDADQLDFTEFQDAMDLDASTSITADGTEVLSISNTGTGNSFRVDDVAGDTTPFVIDATGNVGIGTDTPGAALHVTTAARVGGNNSAAGLLEILEDTDAGSNKVSITAQAMAADYTLTLPVDDGNNGNVLQSNGSGSLSWGTITATNANQWTPDGYLSRFSTVTQDLRLADAWEGIVFGTEAIATSGWTRTAGTAGTDTVAGVPDAYRCSETGIYRVSMNVFGSKASGNPFLAIRATFGGDTSEISGSLSQKAVNGNSDFMGSDFLFNCSSTSSDLKFWFRSDAAATELTAPTDLGANTSPSARVIIQKT